MSAAHFLGEESARPHDASRLARVGSVVKNHFVRTLPICSPLGEEPNVGAAWRVRHSLFSLRGEGGDAGKRHADHNLGMPRPWGLRGRDFGGL